MEFSIGLHYLDIGIGVALFAGIFWWMYVLTSRSHAERQMARSVKKITRQPWGDDKAGGRGNR
jgi:threonine/homoserine efflux transporter RhtA